MKIINKVLLVLVLAPFFNTFALGYNTYQAQVVSKDLFQVQKEEIQQPVLDIGTVEQKDSEEVAAEEEAPVEETATEEATFALVPAQSEEAVTAEEAGVLPVDNTEKEESFSGENVLEVQTPNTLEGELSTYYLTDGGALIENPEDLVEVDTLIGQKEEEQEVVNEIDVVDNKIVSTDEGIISTIGGTDEVIYAYQTLEDAQTKEAGIPISGGAFDAQYLGTENSGDDYYAHVIISGLEGYISLDDAQVIPSGLIKSQSHFENVDGDWVYYEATDPLLEDSYLTYAIGEAPEWAESGVEYYSYDDETYTTEGTVAASPLELASSNDNTSNTAINAQKQQVETTNSTEYYSYFQNLPFTSTSSYSGADYKSYLKHLGYTNSQYYNDTEYFVQAQNEEKINSLYLFAMANHESAYGTSEYAKSCNNFFGWGAYDSSPDTACSSAYHYDRPKDGIMAQAKHLTQMWGDLEDKRWAGTEVGNKSHGVNVYYASDTNWGKKVATHMYEIDDYLGGYDEDLYRIYEITSTQTVYKSYSSGQKLQLGESGSEENYKLLRTNGNPRVLVTGSNSEWFKFQLPTPINNSSSDICKFSDANNGSYPAFDGMHNEEVEKGVASFACEYDHWSDQQGWYPAEDSNGNATYKVISNSNIHQPEEDISTAVSTNNKMSEIRINGNNIAIDGYAKFPGKPESSTGDITQKLILKDSDGKRYSLTLPQTTNSDLGSYKGYGIDDRVISLAGVPEGSYSLRIKTINDDEVHEESLYTTMPRQVRTTYSLSSGRYYELTIYSTGTANVTIKPITQKNNLYDVDLNHSKISVSGYSLLRGISSTALSSVHQDLILQNSNHKYQYGLKETKNPQLTKSFGDNKYKYDAYGIDPYREIDLQNIKTGTYTLRIRTDFQNSYAITKDAKSENRVSLEDTWGGYRYRVYKDDDQIKVSKTKI